MYWLKFMVFGFAGMAIGYYLELQAAPDWFPTWIGWSKPIPNFVFVLLACFSRYADAISTTAGLEGDRRLAERAPGLGERPTKARLCRLATGQSLLIVVLSIVTADGWVSYAPEAPDLAMPPLVRTVLIAVIVASTSAAFQNIYLIGAPGLFGPAISLTALFLMSTLVVMAVQGHDLAQLVTLLLASRVFTLGGTDSRFYIQCPFLGGPLRMPVVFILANAATVFGLDRYASRQAALTYLVGIVGIHLLGHELAHAAMARRYGNGRGVTDLHLVGAAHRISLPDEASLIPIMTLNEKIAFLGRRSIAFRDIMLAGPLWNLVVACGAAVGQFLGIDSILGVDPEHIARYGLYLAALSLIPLAIPNIPSPFVRMPFFDSGQYNHGTDGFEYLKALVAGRYGLHNDDKEYILVRRTSIVMVGAATSVLATYCFINVNWWPFGSWLPASVIAILLAGAMTFLNAIASDSRVKMRAIDIDRDYRHARPGYGYVE